MDKEHSFLIFLGILSFRDNFPKHLLCLSVFVVFHAKLTDLMDELSLFWQYFLLLYVLQEYKDNSYHSFLLERRITCQIAALDHALLDKEDDELFGQVDNLVQLVEYFNEGHR